MSTVQDFDFSVDLLQALLWQHNKAEALTSLLEQKQAWYDAQYTEFWTAWIRDVFNVDTANEFGLQVWGIILGLPLQIINNDDGGKQIFGFGALRKNFNNGNFSSTTGTIRLSLEQKRLAIKLRYFQLTTRGTVPEINAMLARVFGSYGPAYVRGSGMAGRYTFGFAVPSGLRLLFDNFDLLPRPAGVLVDWVEDLDVGRWGFGEFRKNFNNGTF